MVSFGGSGVVSTGVSGVVSFGGPWVVTTGVAGVCLSGVLGSLWEAGGPLITFSYAECRGEFEGLLRPCISSS